MTFLVACLGLGVGAAQAKPVELYRFENEDGVLVLSNSIPPELVYKGYSVVTEDGTVVRVVPRQLTPAEVAQRDRRLAAEKAAEEAGAARTRHDEELVKLYASPRDVEEARARKIQSIDAAIATTKSNLERLKLQKERVEEQAADREREGLPPSPEILDNLNILDTQIAAKNAEIESRKAERQRVDDQFALDLARIKLLYGVEPIKTASKNDPAH
jgi:hypothetical protein